MLENFHILGYYNSQVYTRIVDARKLKESSTNIWNASILLVMYEKLNE